MEKQNELSGPSLVAVVGCSGYREMHSWTLSKFKWLSIRMQH
jgi:hypothetical protein